MMNNNQALTLYIRKHPKWYIILSREPWRYDELVQRYKEEHNQTFSSRIEQVSMILSMMEMML